SGASRALDSGPWAPKGIVLAETSYDTGARPVRPFRDDVVYEVHLRGLTAADPGIAQPCRGTYAGAASRASYLRDLGVTAIELLPIHESPNDRNDIPPPGPNANYWG